MRVTEPHDTRLRGEQKAKWEWHTEHPLPNRFIWQYFIDYVCRAILHAPRTTTWAEASSFAAESELFFVMT
jgi:hypothetical protein